MVISARGQIQPGRRESVPDAEVRGGVNSAGREGPLRGKQGAGRRESAGWCRRRGRAGAGVGGVAVGQGLGTPGGAKTVREA